MKLSFFTIVIPTLNEEKFLPQILKDLALQTQTDFTVVVADGGSKDRTVEITRTFPAPYPLSVIVPKTNVSASRNAGAKKAQGKYLVFFDADVRIAPRFLEDLQQKIQTFGVDYATTRSLPDTVNPIDHVVTYLIDLLMIGLNKLGKPFMGGQCLIVKTEVFRRLHGFAENVIHAEDHELVQRAKRQGFRGEVFYSPVHTVSFRRFEREGRLRVAAKWLLSFLHILFKGPITKSIFTYKMGGKVD